MTVSLLKATDICCNCGRDCAIPTSIHIDPLCTACKHHLRALDTFPRLDGSMTGQYDDYNYSADLFFSIQVINPVMDTPR